LPPLAAEDYEVAIGLLAQEGCTKIDVLGGDLFRVPQLVPSILEQAKRYGIFTGVITNGAFATVGSNLDMFGVSIDSFDTETNERMKKSKVPLKQLLDLRNRAKDTGVLFRLNTVISTRNVDEDFTAHMNLLDVDQWKICKALGVSNDGGAHCQDVRVSDADFQGFLDRHRRNNPVVADPHTGARNHYIVLDEHLRFIDWATNEHFTESMLLDNTALSTALERLDLRARRGGVV
tara:strand:- start:1170 stop:1871 length:702 start_codon:yes stop_codon:yes gene_type:complete